MGSLHCPVTFPPLLNMKSMILFAVFLAVAAAAPLEETKPILIKSQTQNHDTEKQVYSFSTKVRTVSSSARAESRSRSETSPKNPEPSPKANSPTPKLA